VVKSEHLQAEPTKGQRMQSEGAEKKKRGLENGSIARLGIAEIQRIKAIPGIDESRSPKKNLHGARHTGNARVQTETARTGNPR